MSDRKPSLKDFFDKARGEQPALPPEEMKTLIEKQQFVSAVNNNALSQLFHAFAPMKMAATFAFIALVTGGAYYYVHMSHKAIGGHSIAYENKKGAHTPSPAVEAPGGKNANTDQALPEKRKSSEHYSRKVALTKNGIGVLAPVIASGIEQKESLLCLDAGKMPPHNTLVGPEPINQDFLYPASSQLIIVDTMFAQ